jgi:hypothetical protein
VRAIQLRIEAKVAPTLLIPSHETLGCAPAIGATLLGLMRATQGWTFNRFSAYGIFTICNMLWMPVVHPSAEAVIHLPIEHQREIRRAIGSRLKAKLNAGDRREGGARSCERTVKVAPTCFGFWAWGAGRRDLAIPLDLFTPPG